MRRSNQEYSRIFDLVIDIYLDYNITKFPIDMRELCNKMGIILVPYSSFSTDDLPILIKKSKYGFSTQLSTTANATIYYNDTPAIFTSEASINQTIGHEIKHLLEEDTDDSEDDLCDFFAKNLRCPLPYVMYLGITNPHELMDTFCISYSQANIVLDNINSRKRSYGNKFFKKEEPLLRLLIKESFDASDYEWID